MVNAFIFDMDGVLINSEAMWIKYESDFLDNLFGKEITSKIGDTIGVSSRTINEKAKALGFKEPLDTISKTWDETAFRMYDKANITPNTDVLGEYLIRKGFNIGIVSSSRLSWIYHVLPRLSFRNKISKIISLADRADLKPKPSPDGYNEMIKTLGSLPSNTIILEDSNSGIKAATESGAYVISFSQNLIQGYKQIDLANVRTKNMVEVIEAVKKWLRNKQILLTL